MSSSWVKTGWSFAALVVSTTACGANVVVDGACDAGAGPHPLLGSWVNATGTEHLTFNADGTASSTETKPSCTGVLTFTSSWTSTPTTVTRSGITCTGQVICPDSLSECAPNPPVTCSYETGCDDTLLLTCPQVGTNTFTRTM